MSKLRLTAALALALSASAVLPLAWAEEGPPIVPQREDEESGPGRYDAAEPEKAQDPEDAREYESRKGAIDGVAPATREDLSPNVPRAADEAISPRFEALEAALGRRVAAWQERIEALRARAVAEDDAELGGVVEDLEGDFIVLVNQWRLLQQTADPDQWETGSTKFRAALDRFENEWQNKVDIDAEGM